MSSGEAQTDLLKAQDFLIEATGYATYFKQKRGWVHPQLKKMNQNGLLKSQFKIKTSK